ncbi:MAG TPA: MBL fold metallo-hydrolase [Caulobacteraceae bacterium]|jgi:phosphoribosyl 1,2-cyclic phosphate phosphodiesterase
MNGAVLQFTILGCGSSAGVPRADGAWGACDPSEPKNRRTRCSMLVRRKADAPGEPETTVVIDTSPEFRQQAAAAGAVRMDAVLYTHDHADQTHGIDDLRAFWIHHRRRTPCYMDAATRSGLTRRFAYVFEGEGGYPPICDLHLLPPHGQPWEIQGPSGAIPVLTFDQDHGAIRSVGYRLGAVAYSSDIVGLPDNSVAMLEDLEVWIVDALRLMPHPTHAHLDMALEWIERLKPRRAILTNMHQDLDYEALARSLPDGVIPAYDGMTFEVPWMDENASSSKA